MTVTYPRRTCPVCQRPIAIPNGKFARHDPEWRAPGWPLVSCTGSMRLAPLGGEQPVLFDPEDQAVTLAAQLGLFAEG
ncbi:hypothetical protein ACPYPG_06935 [Streptomyces sp. FR-108]|uniref:hypothetical protein n=1 Tax=Streptomyces sp. FR-108 TaxID=3416665 RepID=UPI003CE98B15